MKDTGKLATFSKEPKVWRSDFEADIPSGAGGLFSETIEEPRRSIPVAGIGFADDRGDDEPVPHYAKPTMCSPVPTMKRATRTFALAHNLDSPRDVIARDDEKSGAVTIRPIGPASSRTKRSRSVGAASRRATVNLADLARSIGLQSMRAPASDTDASQKDPK